MTFADDLAAALVATLEDEEGDLTSAAPATTTTTTTTVTGLIASYKAARSVGQLAVLPSSFHGSDEATRVLSAYAHVAYVRVAIGVVLDAALPVQASIDYWSAVVHSPVWAAYVLLNELPFILWAKRGGEEELLSFPSSLVQLLKTHLTTQRRLQGDIAIALGTLSQCGGDAVDVAQIQRLLADVFLEGGGEGGDQEPTSTAATLEATLHAMRRYQSHVDRVQGEHGVPSLVRRHWVAIVAAVCLFRVSQNQAVARWDDWVRLAVDMKDLVVRFAMDYLVEPVVHMYGVVRYKQHELTLVEAQSVQADLESLQRMLSEFRTDVGTQTRGGGMDADLVVLMHHYEHDVRSPISSLLFGNMARLLLIQVQKTKVDLELAMTALDKLLKANEINFALVTFVPAVYLTSLAIGTVRGAWERRYQLDAHQSAKLVRKLLRGVDVILNRHASKETNKLPLDEQGNLLMNVHILRQCAHYSFPSADDRVDFLHDLRELEAVANTVRQRLHTLERIYRLSNL